MDLEPERVLDLMRYGRDHVSLDAPVRGRLATPLLAI
jgi:hypothetical protein